jgi:hypothetical protein
LRRVDEAASRPILIGDPVPLVGDYTSPILQTEAAAVVKQRGEISASRPRGANARSARRGGLVHTSGAITI